ncbi:uncharacterized protein PG998_008239 [Apiospora kogelbergensis]|uniref:Htaa protein n=1 Tax=Apiospora kogelbergensis TaxID=1337665 RepID=A0AAW0QAZ6_9PEZI
MLPLKTIGRLLVVASVAASLSTEITATTSSRDLMVLETRDLTIKDEPKKFDLGWQVKDRPIFSGQWTGAVARGQHDASATTKVSVECLDCRTWGTVTAQVELTQVDLHRPSVYARLNFTNVGGYFNFGLAASAQGTYVFQLPSGKRGGKKDKKTVRSRGVDADISLIAELIIQVSASVEASGGFHFAVTDNTTGLQVKVPDFSSVILPLPDVKFGLIPVAINDTSANITAAIRFRADAGIVAEAKGLSATGKAGAFLNLAQVTLSGRSSPAAGCFSVDVESNAGAYAYASACGKKDCTGDAAAAATVFYRGSYGQTVVATNVETMTTSSCPSATVANAAAYALAINVAAVDKIEHAIALTSAATEISSVNTEGIAKPTASIITGQYVEWAKESEEKKEDKKDGDGKKDEDDKKKNAVSARWESPNGLLGMLGFFAAVLVCL